MEDKRPSGLAPVEEINSAYEFIKEHATPNKRSEGDNVLSRDNYYKLAEQQGLPKDVMAKVTSFNSALINGAMKYNAEVLRERIGGMDNPTVDDYKKAVTNLAINTPMGELKVSNRGYKTSVVPAVVGSSDGAKRTIHSYNKTTVHWANQILIDKEMLKADEDAMRELLDIDE